MRLSQTLLTKIAGTLATGGVIAAGAIFIGQHEGKVNDPYIDSAGVVTVCYGHTDRIGTYPPIEDRRYSDAECDGILKLDLEETQKCLDQTLAVPVADGQKLALLSFVFNVGCDAFSRSTLLAKLNASDYEGASAEFAKWNKAGGRVLAGLKDRRADERIMWGGKIE